MEAQLKQIIDPVLERCDAILGGEYSAVLYGSGARGEFLAGCSDVNLLVVAEALSPEVLRRLAPVFKGLPRGDETPPLLFERAEWLRASDVFPIEVTDMQHTRAVVRGPDPVAGLTVDRRLLRAALEGELRAKLLRLRQAYALRAGDPAALGHAAQRSASAVAALLRVTLLLHRLPAPVATLESITAAGRGLGIPTGPTAEFWVHRGDRSFPCPPSAFEEYLSTVAALVGVLDRFTIPGGD